MYLGSYSIITLLCTLCVSFAKAKGAAGMEIRSYNAVHRTDFKNMQAFEMEFLFQGALKEQVVLGVYATDDCFDLVQHVNLVGIQRFTGVHALKYVSVYAPNFTGMIACAEVLHYSKGSTLDQPHSRTDVLDYLSINDWIFTDVLPIDISVKNSFDFPVSLIWHEENSEPMMQMVLQPSDDVVMGTFIGEYYRAVSIAGA